MSEPTDYNGDVVYTSEFVGDFYDLEFEWPEVVEADEANEPDE